MEYKKLTESKYYEKLKEDKSVDLKNVLSKERVEASSIKLGGGLTYNYAAMPVDENIIKDLQKLADDMDVIEKYKAILSGEVMNPGEKRLVLHHLTRGSVLKAEVIADGENKEEFYNGELQKIKEFSQKVRSGEIKGSTGKKFKTICQIGIGGSDLGPRALYIALEGWAKGSKTKMLEGKFISNVDPDDAAAAISSLNLETTLFVLVSKSGTTQETLTNRDLVLNVLSSSPIDGFVASKHIVAVTSKTSPLSQDKSLLASFFIDDYIGGRYSSTSAVGGVILSLCYGFNTFNKLLKGAHEEDRLSLGKNIKKNGALMDALIGMYLRNIKGYPTTAILPYSQALSRFPAHLQQLDMESNGKHVDRRGKVVDYPTGPVIYGEPGTNGQHSFYQLLHQGTDIVPLQFIGFRTNQRGLDIVTDGSTSTEKLNANLAAQIVAFALGKEDENPNKEFDGGRPSSLIYGDKLTPASLGALLAHYENKVMFQGFLWNLNSFDQEGVQLGKKLAKKVLSGCEGDEVLSAFSSLLK